MRFNLQSVRERASLSQEELARICEVSTSTIQKYESGKKPTYTLKLIEKFCETLNCEPGELFVWVES